MSGDSIPVCKILEYGKFLYKRKKGNNQKKKTRNHIKTIKMRPAIGIGDMENKINQIVKFIGQGNKVKVIVFFRGREHAHKELGVDVLNSIKERIVDICKIEGESDENDATISFLATPIHT